jgi:FkbM family methyltransferase
MSYRNAVLRIADNIASFVFYASRRKPSFYCDRWIWIPSAMWDSLFSRYEPAVAQALCEHLHEGETFWDIGANIGWFSVFARNVVGSTGRVVSFEPSPEVFEILSSNAKIVGGITTIRAGLGNADELRLFAAQGKSSSSSFVEKVTEMNVRFNPAVPIQKIEVEIRKIDSLVKEWRSEPSLLKIDVEGFELEVLRGATDLLSRRQPTFIIEVHPGQLELSGGSEELLFQFLRDHTYEWNVIDRNVNSLYTIVAEPRKMSK